MGALYTLRPGSMARLELIRDMRADKWYLRRGTVFVGGVVGGDLDRAYVQIKGYIDPESQGLVRLDGELLGSDGGSGLRGKRRRVSPAWVKVLDRVAQAGTQIATGLINRRGSSVIIASDPYGTYRSMGDDGVAQVNNSHTFVEVPAGAVGFVTVTTLPEQVKPTSRLAEGPGRDGFNDEELAELMSSSDPARIRAALPRMNPELRQIALTVLKEIEAAGK
jgi:hypothetical protein